MREANHVHGARVIGENRIERSVGTSIGEIAQKGIAGTQRKKAERNAIRPAFTRKNAVENFVDRAVAANRKEFSIALSVGLACKRSEERRVGKECRSRW